MIHDALLSVIESPVSLRCLQFHGIACTGLIVEYIGIADMFKSTLQQYTENDRKTAGIGTDQAVDSMLERIQLIREQLHGHDFSKFASEKASERMKAIIEKVDYVLGLGLGDQENIIW